MKWEILTMLLYNYLLASTHILTRAAKQKTKLKSQNKNIHLMQHNLEEIMKEHATTTLSKKSLQCEKRKQTTELGL